MYDQINTALLSIKDLFQKQKKNVYTNMHIFFLYRFAAHLISGVLEYKSLIDG